MLSIFVGTAPRRKNNYQWNRYLILHLEKISVLNYRVEATWLISFEAFTSNCATSFSLLLRMEEIKMPFSSFFVLRSALTMKLLTYFVILFPITICNTPPCFPARSFWISDHDLLFVILQWLNFVYNNNIFEVICGTR